MPESSQISDNNQLSTGKFANLISSKKPTAGVKNSMDSIDISETENRQQKTNLTKYMVRSGNTSGKSTMPLVGRGLKSPEI